MPCSFPSSAWLKVVQFLRSQKLIGKSASSGVFSGIDGPSSKEKDWSVRYIRSVISVGFIVPVSREKTAVCIISDQSHFSGIYSPSFKGKDCSVHYIRSASFWLLTSFC